MQGLNAQCIFNNLPLSGKIECMNQGLTLVTKLRPTPEQVAKLDATLQAFADACNYVNDNTDPKLTNKVALQALTYYTIKFEFKLVANMAVRACARVAANRKTAKQNGKSVKRFNPTSMDCDRDLFRLREQDWTVSLATIQGRERVKLEAGNYQRGKLAGRKPTSAQLCKHRNGNFYLHIQLKNEVLEPGKTEQVSGIAPGSRDIAIASEGDSGNDENIQQIREKFSKLRASLKKNLPKARRRHGVDAVKLTHGRFISYIVEGMP
jgi:transposase